ncbi:MAG: nickel pincer cofactor biosynthesis protein LarB [archaeon]
MEKMLKDFKDGKITLKEVMARLKSMPFEDAGFAKIDTHRTLRKGFPEVIYCKGKTVEQVVKIFEMMDGHGCNILATRADAKTYEAVKRAHPRAVYNEHAGTIVIQKEEMEPKKGLILVITAGTSDIPVAEEAVVTAELMGNRVEKVYDAGVAGIHRLLHYKEKIFDAGVIIVVAGMEGALASVVGGLASVPIIAVPTSVGYGASFEGVAPLLTMLNCCSPGVAVVNIDNGFGAGYFAGIINR